MNVRELISALEKLPQESEVFKVTSDSCGEYNSEGFYQYDDIDSVDFQEHGSYPYLSLTNVVVL